MKKRSQKKLEVFLFLAQREAMRNFPGGLPESDSETQSAETPAAMPNEFFSFVQQLPKAEAEKFERLRSNFQNKTEAEKSKWLEKIESAIGTEEFSIDDSIHRSHVEAALSRETLAIQKIIKPSLPSVYQLGATEEKQTNQAVKDSRSEYITAIEKTVRKTFAEQFVALRDLPEVKTFDRLSGAQLARLVRLAGIREVTYACARIESVESLAAFLRRFAPEDARAIAAQLSGLPKIADERIAFAETIVQNALEIEPQPTSAMLDWLGIRLLGIMLCAREEFALRTTYTEQKLPLETAPTLAEIIETQCRQTPDALKRKIGAEIERLAEMVSGSDGKAEQNKI